MAQETGITVIKTFPATAEGKKAADDFRASLAKKADQSAKVRVAELSEADRAHCDALSKSVMVSVSSLAEFKRYRRRTVKNKDGQITGYEVIEADSAAVTLQRASRDGKTLFSGKGSPVIRVKDGMADLIIGAVAGKLL